MFAYPCPFCSQRLMAPPDRVGQRTLCPKCLRPLVIPSPDASTEENEIGGPQVEEVIATPPPLEARMESSTPAPAGLPAETAVIAASPSRSTVVPAPTTRSGVGRGGDGWNLPDPPTLGNRSTAGRAGGGWTMPESPPPETERNPVPPPPTRPAAERPTPDRPPVEKEKAAPARVTAPLASRNTTQDSGIVLFNGSSPAAADIAAQLTAAISLRMKPPPEPPTDLRLSTGLWLALSAVAVTLWVAGVLYDPTLFPFVVLIGILLSACGYLWAAYLAGHKDWTKGLLALLPPVTLMHLIRPTGENGRRPLWLLLTGLALIALAFAGKPAAALASPVTEYLTGKPRVTDDPAREGPVGRLKAGQERRQPDALIAELTELALPSTVKNASTELRSDVIAELTKLTKDERQTVRSATLTTLVMWDAPAARAPVLAALSSTDANERKAALLVAPHFRDADVAKAVAARFVEKDERAAVRDALLKIGGPVAEAAVIPLIKKTDDVLAAIYLCEVLEAVGSSASVEALTEASNASKNPLIRTTTAEKAKAISERLAGGK